VIQWETSSEIHTAGFYLFRLNEETGGYEPVVERMLPAMIDSPGEESIGSSTTEQQSGKRYRYLLVEVEFSARGMNTGLTPSGWKVKDLTTPVLEAHDLCFQQGDPRDHVSKRGSNKGSEGCEGGSGPDRKGSLGAERARSSSTKVGFTTLRLLRSQGFLESLLKRFATDPE